MSAGLLIMAWGIFFMSFLIVKLRLFMKATGKHTFIITRR